MLSTSQKIDGWCTSLRVLVHMVSTPLVGALADRHGRLRMVFLSVAVTTGCALVFAAAASMARLAPQDGSAVRLPRAAGPVGHVDGHAAVLAGGPHHFGYRHPKCSPALSKPGEKATTYMYAH